MIASSTAAEAWDVSDEEYFADTSSVSNTALGWFLKSPELYHGIMTGIYPQPTFEAAAIGKAVHSILLDGVSIADVAVLIPSSVLSASGSRAGANWKAFEAENAGKLLLKAGEMSELSAIINAVTGDAMASRLLAMRGPTEQAIRWTCKVSGLQRRAKLDKLGEGTAIVVDLKTTKSADARDFATSAYRLGYNRQAAFYQDAYEALHGKRPQVVFIAVEKTAPYTCQCFELDGEFLTMGRDVMEQGLEDLAGRMESGNWTRPEAGTVLTLSAPTWAKYASDWSFEQ